MNAAVSVSGAGGRVLRAVGFAGGAIAASVACTNPEPADLLLHSGTVLVLDEAGTTGTALAVRDGKVLAVGGDELRDRYAAEREVDLAGRTAMPGFNDAHIHIRGRARRHIPLGGISSIEELQDLVAAKADELGPGEWVTGYGWSEDEVREQRRPLRDDLDAAAPENPVILTRAGGHSAVASSLALSLAGVDENTPQPDGGVIERDANGVLNGVIRERQDLVSRLAPDPTPEELRESFVAALRDLLRVGITSIVHAGVAPSGFGEWESVYAEFGEELPRAAVQIRWAGREAMEAFGRLSGEGDERLRVGPLKVFVDGGFTGPAAYTKAPYRGEESYRGSLVRPEEEFREIVREAHTMGWQFAFHAIGDAAIELAVDAFADALAEEPRPDHRHALNHFTVPPSDETMDRMADLGILVIQQPNFTYTLEGRYREYLDGYRVERNNPVRSAMNRGVFMVLSSDILPIGPMVGLYAATTRKGMSGEVYGPGEAISMEEALVGYTRNGAFVTREEGIKGTLAPGMLADVVVLSDDPRAVEPEAVPGIEAEMTIVGGRVLYEKPS